MNPLGESSPGAVSTDVWGFQGEIEAFAIRQGTTTPSSGIAGGSGSLIFDDLLVGSTFASVMPIPSRPDSFCWGRPWATDVGTAVACLLTRGPFSPSTGGCGPARWLEGEEQGRCRESREADVVPRFRWEAVG